jgi:hypothetical protein
MQWNNYAIQVIEGVATAKLTKYRAAIQLDVSVRTIELKLAAYRALGSSAFRHGNADRKPAHAIDFKDIIAIVEDRALTSASSTVCLMNTIRLQLKPRH